MVVCVFSITTLQDSFQRHSSIGKTPQRLLPNEGLYCDDTRVVTRNAFAKICEAQSSTRMCTKAADFLFAVSELQVD